MKVTLHDDRWKRIDALESEWRKYLEESENFLYFILNPESSCGTNPSDMDESNAKRPSSTYILPKKPARYYVRKNKVDEIAESLGKDTSVTLWGIAGVGKTSLALHFAYASMSEYNLMIWITCEPASAMDQSCHEALQRLELVSDHQQTAQNRRIWREYLVQARI